MKKLLAFTTLFLALGSWAGEFAPNMLTCAAVDIYAPHPRASGISEFAYTKKLLYLNKTNHCWSPHDNCSSFNAIKAQAITLNKNLVVNNDCQVSIKKTQATAPSTTAKLLQLQKEVAQLKEENESLKLYCAGKTNMEMEKLNVRLDSISNVLKSKAKQE